MSEPFHYQTEFVLDRSHYEECFDESAKPQPGWRPYAKAMGFVVFGFVLIAMPIEDVIGYLFIGLAAVEGLSVKFRRPWWLWRQLMSKAANHSVNFELDDDGIRISSDYVNQSIRWQQIDSIDATGRGYLLNIGKGRSYISRRVLNDEANAFIRGKIKS
ncbi:YcxB family protein [Shewanella submarina]|uniref:YcxB family protein n=1 Tax=Shewanella submarina TaxID=2016376 RepID=A0ABV7GJL5_9GAMM|nr:YcxB family protein [Shewanella submarina]MCL1036154.1 YcxB family protein [Shewanella submarina]